MKLNNKGFAITTILYGTLILFLLLLVSMLGILATYNDRLGMLIDSNNGARCIINGNCGDGLAYAIYSSDDGILRFYKNNDEVTIGDTYKGQIVTDIFTGFEEDIYSEPDDVPWVKYQEVINEIIFIDEIKPISTANWFYGAFNCYNYDLSKLNTSEVTNMNSMFDTSSLDIFDEPITFVGLENFDTSKVTSMNSMFYQTGTDAEYSLDLSGWNVSNVVDYEYFAVDVEDKIISPSWEN